VASCCCCGRREMKSGWIRGDAWPPPDVPAKISFGFRSLRCSLQPFFRSRALSERNASTLENRSGRTSTAGSNPAPSVPRPNTFRSGRPAPDE